MTDNPILSEENHQNALALFEKARKQETDREYEGAMKSYEQSLELEDDETVKAAYFKLLATIGPL